MARRITSIRDLTTEDERYRSRKRRKKNWMGNGILDIGRDENTNLPVIDNSLSDCDASLHALEEKDSIKLWRVCLRESQIYGVIRS